MPQQKDMVAFVGDIVAISDVSVSMKGGSLNATLKKGIREVLGECGDYLTAAALKFSSDQAVVLLSGGMGASGALGAKNPSRFRIGNVTSTPAASAPLSCSASISVPPPGSSPTDPPPARRSA